MFIKNGKSLFGNTGLIVALIILCILLYLSYNKCYIGGFGGGYDETFICPDSVNYPDDSTNPDCTTPPESPPLIDSDVHWKDLLKSLRNQEGYCDFPLPDIISNYESLLDMLSDEKSKAIVFDISKYNSIATKINDSMISKSRSFDAFFLLHRELKSVDNYVNMKKDSRQPSFAPEKAMESSIFPAKIISC